ncbi:MAG: ISL3 family transposase [PVC group bacterium]|nr:ISL3 family transposase [PVC group bacterium]
MDDKRLYSKLLGLQDPWFISDIEFNESDERIDIHVKHHNPIVVTCPVCRNSYAPYDHGPERVFQHLNTCQFKTFVHVRLPRVKCPTHGVRQILSEFGESGSDKTFAFESYLIDLAKECSIQAVSRLTGVSWDRLWHVVDRSVARGFKRKKQRLPIRIGVDEKSFAKGHTYETLVYDINKGTVEYVGDYRNQQSLEAYFRTFSYKERNAVEAVTMDMWDPYIAATKLHIPDALNKIIFDRFHVMKIITDAVDKVRREEHKELRKQNVDVLKGTRYLWLWARENVPPWRLPKFKELQNLDLKVCRAWAIKENLRHFWDYSNNMWAAKFFDKWYRWACHCRLEPIMKAAKTIKRHYKNIATYIRHRITNALGESLNGKIEKVKRLACGFRNREHYKTAIYFHCGGLDLYPKPPVIKTLQWKTS